MSPLRGLHLALLEASVAAGWDQLLGPFCVPISRSAASSSTTLKRKCQAFLASCNDVKGQAKASCLNERRLIITALVLIEWQWQRQSSPFTDHCGSIVSGLSISTVLSFFYSLSLSQGGLGIFNSSGLPAGWQTKKPWHHPS
ncbi:hypothetical protein VTO42DRAFT_6816 [Malbranchea cinnamomea]